jgi:HipA-like protein
LYAEPIGTLFEADDRYGIAFDEAYRNRAGAPILSLSLLNAQRMPRAPKTTMERVHPFFVNLLPERGSVLRNYLARTNGVDETDDFALLDVLGARAHRARGYAAHAFLAGGRTNEVQRTPRS